MIEHFHISVWAGFYITLLMALVTPGANTILLIQKIATNRISEARNLTLGFALGSFTWAFLALLLQKYFQEFPIISLLLKIFGFGTFVYLSSRAFWNALKNPPSEPSISEASKPSTLSMSTIFEGFITNMTNPFSFAFYLSLTSSVALYTPSIHKIIILSSTIFLLSKAWYSLLLLILTYEKPKLVLLSSRRLIHLSIGIFFAFLAAKTWPY